jgi:nucleoside phosphorylase
MKADIAIITIREDEFEAVLQRFPPTPYHGSSGRTYSISQVQTKAGKNCIVAVVRCSEQGTDVAQQVAHDMIQDLNPQLLLVVGIAGGIPDREFALGDVIISTRIHNFNVNALKDNKIEYDARGGIHPLVSNITASLPMYKQSLLVGWNERNTVGLDRPHLDPSQITFDGTPPSSWCDDITDSLTWHFDNPQNRARPPLFKTASIASSNSLVRNPSILIQWLQNMRSIRAVEMEAAGVYQAAQQMRQQYPVMAIRGISDIVGLKRDHIWTTYACHTAAAFTYAFATAGIVEPRPLASPTSGVPYTAQRAAQGQTATTNDASPPIEVFISYSEDDEKYKKQLETHLAMLKREGMIRPWHSQQAKAGQEWKQEISNLIDVSQIILLLVSPNFLASDYLYEEEMLHAMERHQSGNARVVPIVVRSVDLGTTPFKSLLALPRNNKPVDTWRNSDEIWASIVQEIRRICNDLRGRQSQ